MSIEDLSLDHVTVGVTIESTTLTPEQISQRLGISWDEVKRVGDPRDIPARNGTATSGRSSKRNKVQLNRALTICCPRCRRDPASAETDLPNCARSALLKVPSSSSTSPPNQCRA